MQSVITPKAATTYADSLTCLARFVKQHLHGGLPESIDVDALKKEVEELRQRNGDLESQVAQLQAEVRYGHEYKILLFYKMIALHFFFLL